MTFMPVQNPVLQQILQAYGIIPRNPFEKLAPWNAAPPAPGQPASPQPGTTQPQQRTIFGQPYTPPARSSNPFGRLWQGINSPQGQSFLLSAGQSIMAPRQQGQSQFQQMVGGLANGLGGVAQYYQMLRQRAMEDRAMNMEERKVAATERGVAADELRARTGEAGQKSQAALGQRELDIRQQGLTNEKAYRDAAIDVQNRELQFRVDELNKKIALGRDELVLKNRQLGQEAASEAEKNKLTNRKLDIEQQLANIERMNAITRQKALEAQVGKGNEATVVRLMDAAGKLASSRVLPMRDLVSTGQMDVSEYLRQSNEIETEIFNDLYSRYGQGKGAMEQKGKGGPGDIRQRLSPLPQGSYDQLRGTAPQAGQSGLSQEAPPVGTVVRGWKFKGGHPGDKNSWEYVGGR